MLKLLIALIRYINYEMPQGDSSMSAEERANKMEAILNNVVHDLATYTAAQGAGKPDLLRAFLPRSAGYPNDYSEVLIGLEDLRKQIRYQGSTAKDRADLAKMAS
jgi:hypothetical protein